MKRGSKHRSRAFYRRRRAAAEALQRGEAEALRPWRGWGVALFALGTVAAVGWTVAKLLK